MTDSDDIAIKVRHVGKTFEPQSSTKTVKEGFVGLGRKLTGKKKSIAHHKGEYTALKDINFDVKKGDFFGVVGRNGSGKSTLLKILAGVYMPTKGHVHTDGKLTPFIELGVGFNPELTGHDNVFLNGALLGFTRQQMQEMYDDIVDFAELHEFMDTKLKNYSSGMQVRLAFSIAIRANTEILVLDEVLAVGDYNFQQKCFEYFKYLKKTNKTVVLVSHDANALQNFCNKAILIEDGKVVKSGTVDLVLKAYSEQNQQDQEKKIKELSKDTSKIESGNGYVELLNIFTRDANQEQASAFAPNEDINVSIEFIFHSNIDNPVFGIVFQDSEGGQPIFATNTLDGGRKTGSYKAKDKVEIIFNVKNVFNDGKYYISGAVASSDRSLLYTRFMNAGVFASVGWMTTAKARIYQDYEFNIIKK